ncbi:MAG: response regulator [Clostridia bacterium]|nr:response regulator [Clostridia bacterium]
MITLLIADDERTARDHMIACIDWAKLGLEIIGVAGDGLTAWELMRSGRPDLALIDIRMPGMDGLELIRRASEEGLLTRILIVSGYDHFEYAQKALEYHVFKYILKPYSPEELTEALTAAICDLPSHGRGASASELFDGLAPGKVYYPHELEQEALKAVANAESEDTVLEKSDDLFNAISGGNGSNRALVYCAMIFYAEISRSMLRYGHALPSGAVSLPDPEADDLRETLHRGLRSVCLECYRTIRGSGQSNQLIRAATRYIDAHYTEKLSLTAVAEEIHVSPVYLSGLFTREVGQSFTQYLQQRRIEQAKQLLLHTQEPVDVIAERVGYGDARYFMQVFRRMTGMTPVVYRSRSNTQ